MRHVLGVWVLLCACAAIKTHPEQGATAYATTAAEGEAREESFNATVMKAVRLGKIGSANHEQTTSAKAWLISNAVLTAAFRAVGVSLTVVAAGFAGARFGIIPPAAQKSLADISMKILIPALLFLYPLGNCFFIAVFLKPKRILNLLF